MNRVTASHDVAVQIERFKWPIRTTREIATPIEDLWTAISAPGNLELSHPFCESNPVSVRDGADSSDEIRYLNGKVYQRRFLRWFAGLGYDLEIIEQGRPIALVEWRVESVGRASSSLSIAVYPYLLQKLPAPVRWFPHALFLRPMLFRYLESVVSGFEWYLTRGKPVPRNCFGRHRWFSAY